MQTFIKKKTNNLKLKKTPYENNRNNIRKPNKKIQKNNAKTYRNNSKAYKKLNNNL
jgi:hypothetical protein